MGYLHNAILGKAMRPTTPAQNADETFDCAAAGQSKVRKSISMYNME